LVGQVSGDDLNVDRKIQFELIQRLLSPFYKNTSVELVTGSADESTIYRIFVANGRGNN
jgi:hypothetical protein